MKKIKGYSFTWWTTEMMRILLLIAILIFEIYINFSLFANSSVTPAQKVANVTGVIVICYGWSILVNWVIQSLRTFIRKHIPHKNGYSKEKIALIKKQMNNSVSHLHNKD